MDRKNCDVVVVGSGIGGLCLAARLSHAGYKCVVVERMPVPGGRYTYVDYKGYWICTGGQMLGYGKRDPVLRTLKEVGVSADFDEMKTFPGAKYRHGGRDHETPTKGALWQLISMVSRDKQEADKVIKALKRCFTWQEPSDAMTVSDWVRSVTDNQAIYDIIHYQCTQILGMNAHELPAGELFREMKGFAGVEPLIPKQGLKSVVDALSKVITDNSGEILTLTETTKIGVEDGTAKGVECKTSKDRFTIEAKVVVSNTGPKKTVTLAGEEHFDRGYLKDVRDSKPLNGILFILASDGPLFDCPGGIFTTETQRTHLWFDFTLTWPDWAPKGKNWVYAWQTPDPSSHYDPKKEYEIMVADVAQTFPTFAAQNGEILLAKNHCAEWPAARAGACQDLPQKTPVENLFNVGDGVKTPDFIGGSGAAESARIVADEIKMRIRL